MQISNLDENLSSNVKITCYDQDEYEEPKTMEFTLMNTLRKESDPKPKHLRTMN